MPVRERSSSIRRRPQIAAATVALLCGAALVLAAGPQGEGPSSARAQAPPAAKPNIIVLLTDDQENGSMRVMKTVNKEMKGKGVTLKNYYDNFPLCCPARTTILTGQYAHNHKVLSNNPPDGGYGVFNELHGDNYLPLWLQNAGYQTSYIGKFENGYAEPDEYGTTPTRRAEGLERLARAGAVASAVLQLHPEPERTPARIRRHGGRLLDRRLHPQGEELHPRQREAVAAVLPRARLRGPTRRRRRRPRPVVQPGRGAGATRPRGAEGAPQGRPPPVLQRGRCLRQAVTGSQPRPADRGPDQ